MRVPGIPVPAALLSFRLPFQPGLQAGISVENHAGVENQRRCFAGTNGLFFGQSGKRISCSYSSGISRWHRRNSGCTTAASIASSPRRGWEAEDGKHGAAL
jgi:hypothetical protein